jgi:hypothetical protein
MMGVRTASCVVLICAIALALAAAARHGLIEPADITARCDGGAQAFWCTARAWIIQAFVNQRIGWAALGLALLATVTGWRSVAAAALFAACAGLILYTTELCAPAALLALLVFVREGHVATAANVSKSAQYDKA